MRITTKTIRTAVITNLLIAGLAACSTAPAPWTETNNSPWSAKHEAEQSSVPSDTVVTDTTLDDHVLLSEPEAVTPVAPAAMEKSNTTTAGTTATDTTVTNTTAAPAPVPVATAETTATPVAEKMTPEQKVLAMSANSYAVQVYASNTIKSMNKFKTDKGLDELKTVKTNRDGKVVYVLVDLQPDRASARQAAKYLKEKTGTKPWIRSVAGLQKIIVTK